MLGCWSPAGLVQTHTAALSSWKVVVQSCLEDTVSFLPSPTLALIPLSAFSFQMPPQPCEKGLWCRGQSLLGLSTLLIFSVLWPVARFYVDQHLLQKRLLRWPLRAHCTVDTAIESSSIQCPHSRIIVSSLLGPWAPNHLLLDRFTEPGMCFLPCSEP